MINKKDKYRFTRLDKILYEKDRIIENYSIINEFTKNGIIGKDFLFVLDKISLEDIIAIKLELSLKTMNGRILNLSFLSKLDELIEKAVLEYAISVSTTIREVANILKLKHSIHVKMLMSKYDIPYFSKGSKGKKGE